jgi:hypothetical protein
MDFEDFLNKVKGHNSSRNTSTPVFKSTRLPDQLHEQIRHLHYSRAPRWGDRLCVGLLPGGDADRY